MHEAAERLLAIIRQIRDDVAEMSAIRRWDRKETLFYLDPPYWGCEGYYGKELFSRADFERLAGVLRGIKGRFIMSLNDHPEVKLTFKGFKIDQVKTVYRLNGAKEVAELLISGGKG